MSTKVIIAGGGTGGHIFPAIAIANALRSIDPTTEILFVGAKDKMEMEKVPQAGYKIIGLDIAGFNRSSLLKNIWLPFKLIKSLWQAGSIVRSFKPDVVVGVGGYASFPMLRNAQRKGVPTLIQEQNSFAGKSNQLLGKRAKKICVAYDNMQQFFAVDKLVLTGNPVRATIANSLVTREEGVRFFGLDPAKKVVLVVGGSLGAKSVNEAIAGGLNGLEAAGLQLIWQTGKPYAVQAKQLASGQQHIWTNEFITQMEMGYAAADVVISRAGALAIAELCVVKKPVVFVPYPFAAEDHQTVNAMSLVNKDAGLMVKDSAVMTELMPAILGLAKDEGRQAVLRANIAALGRPDADMQIARQVLLIKD